jgi:hypothetical protein
VAAATDRPARGMQTTQGANSVSTPQGQPYTQ